MCSFHKIVLTGGPCAGKSTCLEVLRREIESLGYTVFVLEEGATRLINAGFTHEYCDKKEMTYIFQKNIFQYQRLIEQAYAEMILTSKKAGDKIVLLHDRGVLDGAAFCEPELFDRLCREAGLRRQDLLNSYDAVFHMETVAKGKPEFYTNSNNTARRETIEEAIIADNACILAWDGHPHHYIIDNDGPDFMAKVDTLVTNVKEFLNEREKSLQIDANRKKRLQER